MDWLNETDSRYYPLRHTPRNFPVTRLSFADADQSVFCIAPDSGRILGWHGRTGRGVPDESFNALMAKLERTGLYLKITGNYLDYSGDIGTTTPLLARVIALVNET